MNVCIIVQADPHQTSEYSTHELWGSSTIYQNILINIEYDDNIMMEEQKKKKKIQPYHAVLSGPTSYGYFPPDLLDNIPTCVLEFTFACY